MVKRNKNGFPIIDTRAGIDDSQLTRLTLMDGIGKEKEKKIKKFSEKYINFLDKIRIAPDVVEKVREIAKKSNFNMRDFYTNEEETAFALVRKGKKDIREGIKILYSHCDSPCIKIKVNAPLLEWDPDEQPLHTGVELDTFGYGGINPHQWTGRFLDLVGWAVINGKRKKINLPVYSPEICAHTDTRQEEETKFGEAHTEESIDLITGEYNVKNLLKKLGFKGKEDFARARLFAVPNSKTQRIGHNYITGYGHDNRIGVFSSIEAFLCTNNPEYTSMVFGFDKEEIWGLKGEQSKFFDQIFYKTFSKQNKKRKENINEELKLNIFSKSLAINCDVDIGATNRELEEDRIDIFNISKLGYGTFLRGLDGFCDGEQISPYLVDKVMNSFGGKNVIFQVIGSPKPADMSHYAMTMDSFFTEKGIPTIGVGVPTGCLHSPEEIIHEGDLFYSFEAYKAILKDEEFLKDK
jgi:aspartyl aminopeptidase